MSKEDTNSVGLPLILTEDETGLLNLMDKYIKSNNNFLPLQAYLRYLELNNLNSFLPVSFSSNQTVYNTAYGPINTNSSTFITISNETNESLQIAQKLYKFVISIDYSPQVTNLDFIQKGLETIFDKIKEEYSQFTESINLEPQIYVTVLLWNSAYFQYRQNNQFFNSYLNDDFIPFTTIFHAKRLLKSNLTEITRYIFEKVNEAKSIFLTLFKTSQQHQQRLLQHQESVMSEVTGKILKPVDQQNKSSLQTNSNKEVGSLERLLTHIIKIFSFFNINITATSTSAPTALSSAHHIYISDGLFYANDMIRCLEKISKSAITFSFICSGSSSQRHTANNISSSFGYVADHYLMKFIAQISSGFYAVVDENLDSHFVLKKRLLLHTTLWKQNQKSIDFSLDTIVDNTTTNTNIDEKEPILQITNNFCCNNNHNNENFFYYKETLKTHATTSTHRFSNYKTNSKQIVKEDQKSEIKCIQKYELPSNVHSIIQLARFRTQEGFYLVQITRQQFNTKFDLITLHFKRHFTQTTILFYKLSYFISTSSKESDVKDLSLVATSPSKWSTQENESNNQDKYLIEIWLSWNFLHLKAKYQNLVLIQQLRHTLHHIQKLDFDKSFSLTSLMLRPPDLLRLKEPLFKLANNIDSNEVKAATKLISMQNFNFELNIRNKAMESEFTDFANMWLPIAFFKYNNNTLVKHFAVHTLKLILDHDRLPAPDIYTNIFTLKLDQMQPQQLQYNEQLYDNHDLIHTNNLYDHSYNYLNFNSNNINVQINQNTANNSNNSNNTNNANGANNNSNIFQCRNSLNKLCVMLIDWCDLILVENCVFLKYLNASQLPTSEKMSTNETQTKNDEEPLMDQSTSHTNESFVIIKLDTSCIPYITLQYLFHSTINYLDRMRLIQKFKEKLKVLNLKNLDTDSSNLQTTSAGMTTPPPPSVIITPPQQASSLKLLQPDLSSPSSFKYSSNLVLNQTEANMSNLTSKLKKKQQECCCILLQKPELFDMILSHFNKMNNQHLQIDTKKSANQHQVWQQNPSQVMNFMMQKKYKWTISKTFSIPIGLSLKENIIDAFIRSRLREGFKCLFQSSKLAVFTIQLNMFDQGGLNTNETNRKQTISETDTSNGKSSNLNFKSGSSQFCTFVYVVYFMNNSAHYTQPTRHQSLINMDRKLTDPNDKLDQNELLSNIVNSYDEGVYFTTEIYSEVIDGVYQDKKQNITTENKRITSDYFRNLTYMEIINLIFLIDLKSFLTMQSVSALFLSKSNSIVNLYTLLNTIESIESSLTPLPKPTTSGNFFFGQQETTTKILTCNSNFYESIRMLPDLNLVSKSLQLINQTNSSISRLNSVNDAPTSDPSYVYKRKRPSPIELECKVSVSPSTGKLPLVTDTSNDSKEAASTKKKKSDSVSLHEQLKPVLNSLFSINASATIPCDVININFQFSLRNILLESNLFMSVFEDVPFNLFSSKLNQTNKVELNSIYRIQKMFFTNIDENFKKADPNSTINFMSAPIPRSQHTNRASTASVEDLENKNQNLIMEHVKRELKNTICLRLNEIKSGDVIVKQIIENLNANELELEGRSFHYYFRFNVACATSVEVNYGQTKWGRNVNTEHEQLNNENENRFFIFGLFFLNISNNDQTPASNRLVFFMFDCMPDSIKKSIVNASSNTYLIRKSLFSAQKISNNRSQTETNKVAFSDTYRFYCNKSADLLRQTNNNSARTKTNSSDYMGHRNSTAPNLTSTTPSSFMKKVYSISDILKLNLTNLSNDTLFSSYMDFIEENCAKSYIESVIHYLGLHSSAYSLSHYKQPTALLTDEKRIKFDVNSIKQLLKIGRKTKLVDLDLTDYFKQICSHFKNGNISNLDKKCSLQNNYLEKKFNELFLGKFNQIPDFNDLFIFTSNQYFNRKIQIHDEQISSIDHSFDNGTVSGSGRRRRTMRKLNKKRKSIRIDSDIQTFTASFLDTLKTIARSSESIKLLIEKELNETMNKSLDDFFGANLNTDDDDYDCFNRSDDDDYDDDDYDKIIYSDNDNTSDTNETSFIETKSDINNKNLLTVHSSTTTEEDATTDMDDDMLHPRKNTIRTRRKTSKFKSSSPFSNSSVIINKDFDTAKTKDNPLASAANKSIDEQIINVELVIIIGNDAHENTLMPGLISIGDNLKTATNNGSTTDLDELTTVRPNRVRTTTLTPDYSNTNTLDSLLTTSGLDNSGISNLDTKTISEPIQQVAENEPPLNQFKTSNVRTLFFTKFNKFNLQCLLDLIEEKDQNEFNQLVKQMESEASEYYSDSSRDSFGNNVKVYLRFNWYSFSELNLNFGSSSTANQQVTNVTSTSKLMSQQSLTKNLLQQRSTYQTSMSDTNNLLLQKSTGVTSSVHSSSSTVYNSMSNVASNTNAKYSLSRNFQQQQQQHQFEYYHLLNPILDEFKWHLKDEIFHLEDAKIKYLLVFINHMSHIGEGVRRKYSHCRLTKRKIVLNKITTTTITTLVDPKPKTNASKLLSVNHLREQQQQQTNVSSNKPAYKTLKHVEEDKSILSVDPQKFLAELISLVKNLGNKFYDCQLQQVHDFFYYLNCNINNQNKGNIMLDENLKYSFKILIHLQNKTTRRNLNHNKNNQPPPQPPQQQITSQEITINQIKMKIYYSFNHTSFQNRDDLIDYLIIEFNQLLNNLIKSVYLSLTLKEIHDTRKWNNLLHLVDSNEESKMRSNKSSASLLTNTDPNDSVLTIKNNTVQGSLACNCVWSVKFKLHRLHQTIQKIHGSTEITPSTPSVLQQQISSSSNLQQQQQQQYISQGLKKLQESLVNFKIEESSKCGDLYVYTRKDEIFLLKLEELYEQQSNQSSQTNNQTDVDNSLAYNDNSVDLGASYAKQSQSNKPGSLLSRRPSYASINDTEIAYKANQNVNLTVGKSQNLSGGSTNNNANNFSNANLTQATNLNTTPLGTLQQQSQNTRSNPEYIKLSVFGLTEPDEEMKQDLCKTLQSELDYWLLIKMCNSIEKNTFKTTSAQHPDKITDEDLTFFKSISENYFDFEIPLPFIFNFNKQMRENFFYFIKQIFNSQFKAIDAPINSLNQLSASQFLSGSGQFRKSFSMRAKSSQTSSNTNNDSTKSNETEIDNEYDELANLIYNDECSNDQSSLLSSSTSGVKTSTQTVSSMFHSQQLSFSFMSIQPQLGPYTTTTTSKTSSLDGSTSKPHFCSGNKRTSELDPFMILLSRILFHNSKNMRIGKHTVSLALVEALYAVKSLDVLVLSRVTRSNSIGANSVITPGSTRTNQSNQILETSYTQSKLTGPTFVFRFYCKGENDTNAYKASLKSALNDALLYFFSEYITKIEPDYYLRKIRLNKVPAQFRKFRFQIDQITNTSIPTQKSDKKIKKRHKSTGTCGDETTPNETQEELSLHMNKTAMNTSLGKCILKQQITTESQFNMFTLNNFNNNLFDYRDYEDTIEYFRESIRAFDYNRILNSFIHDANSSTSLLLSSSSASASSIENENSNEENYESDSSESSNISDSNSSKTDASISIDELTQTTMTNNSETNQAEQSSLFSNDNATPTLVSETKKESKLDKSKPNIAFKKSHLRFIYEWLKGLHFVQMRAGTNLCSRSVGSINLKPAQTPTQSRILNQSQPNNQLSSSLIISPLQQQQQPGSSPSNLGGSLANIITSASGQQQPFGPFILRKKFSYKTKYNLTSLLREIEAGLRDSCKSNEITVNYYSFSSEKIKKRKTSDRKVNQTETVTTTSTTTATTTTTTTTNESSHQKELKSCLRQTTADSTSSTPSINQQQSKQRADYYASCFNLDDNEFGNDFKNLKQTKFAHLHTNLTHLENLIITMNVEYCLPVIASSNSSHQTQQQQIHQQMSTNANIAPGSSLSSSSSNNSSTNVLNTITSHSTNPPPTYSRVPSYSGGVSGVTSKQNLTLQQQLFDQQPLPPTSSNLMTKSINSNSGVDLFDLSLSNSLSLTALQLKRTYLYALCNAKTKMITFYVFTTESGCHEQLRQLLDNCCELCLQRYHLVNNTVLYKYGGLIGDSMINDLKKVKQLTSQAVSTACTTTKSVTSTSDSNLNETTNESNSSKSNKQTPISLPQNSPKPIYRQFSHKTNETKYPQPINASLISNLTPQFGGTTTSQASILTPTTSTQQLNLPFKQLIIPQTNYKSFDSIINIINYQVNFCQQYLSNSSVNFNDTFSLVNYLSGSLSHSSSYALLTSSNALIRQTSMINSATNSNLHLQQSVPNRISFQNFLPNSTLYGVGLNYQLYELQQVYRHPKKIYELALTLVNHSPQPQLGSKSSFNTTSTVPTPPLSTQVISKPNQQLTVNEFYRNYIVPVLIPFHFCCSPILFCPNWNELIVNEQTLRANNIKNIENKNNVMQQSSSSSNSGGSNTKAKSTTTNQQTQQPLMICNDAWYQKMRLIFLTEYAKYFEGRGFLRLKDDSKETNNTKNASTEIQSHHFIKWIQQDGFVYITVNLDEIYVNVKLGYCTRYRMASRSFLSEMIKFFAHDFHVHSLTYDLHLLAINRNLTSSSWSSPKHMSLTVSKFLDEFVEFFPRVPLFGSNKVFKEIYERTDYSVLPHKFGLIFDYLMYAKKKLNKDSKFTSCSFTPLDVNLENNIGIYTITDQKPDSYSKYLVIKIESFTTSTQITTQNQTPATQSSASTNKKTISKIDSMHSAKLAANIKQTSQVQPPKLSSSSSSSSLINQRTITSENSLSNLTQSQHSQLIRQNSMQPASLIQQSNKANVNKSTQQNQTKQESHIRLICYYLCINKYPTQFTEHRNSSSNLFSQDLDFIDQIVEISINVYKQETFWDNLMISMSSITDYLNESSTGNQAYPSIPITFSIESNELEQVLNHSQKIDALDLDPSLFTFLKECYSIKDKIRTSFEFSFGRHFIFTSSDSVEYCLLLINDNLIKKFRCTVSSSIQSQQSNQSISLASFALSDRILQSSASSPCSVSSSHSSTTKVSSSTSSSTDTNTDKQLNSFVLLKFDKLYKMTYLWQINRIVQQELNESSLTNTSNTVISQAANLTSIKNNKISSNKYLSFTINNLMFVLWEGLFSN